MWLSVNCFSNPPSKVTSFLDSAETQSFCGTKNGGFRRVDRLMCVYMCACVFVCEEKRDREIACVHLVMCVCVCACVCVCERESNRGYVCECVCVCVCVCVCMCCVCVCVCERERERKRECVYVCLYVCVWVFV